jgi:acyl-coenzyme A thioesterase PaaI-like protein
MNWSWQILRAKLINFYPPLFGAGIYSRTLDEFTTCVEMKLTVFNRNILGAHFGGSLYAMCDPWFALILMRSLGTEFIVWDKAASIKFLYPGRGTVTATFHIPPERISEIRLEASRGNKVEPTFRVDVLDAKGKVIAHVEKLLYVRKNIDQST